MKRIFILEDTPTDYKSIRNSLISNKVSDVQNIFPNFNRPTENGIEITDVISNTNVTDNLSETNNDFDFMMVLFSELSEENNDSLFNLFYSLFDKVDYYIIDKELIAGSQDSYGLDFFKFLVNEKKVDLKKIFVTTTFPDSKLGDIKIAKNHYIPKDKYNKYVETLTKQILSND